MQVLQDNSSYGMPDCRVCGDNRQVWRNQISGKLKCHRAYCETEVPMEDILEAFIAMQKKLAAVEADRAQRVPDGWSPSNRELAAIYKQANGGITPEMGSITAGKVFNAMRAMLASTPALAPAPAQQEPRIPAEFDVRKIMISVSPGEDGMGHEVYASSVADVENLLTSMGQELEEWQLGIRRHAGQHQAPPQQERKPMTPWEVRDGIANHIEDVFRAEKVWTVLQTVAYIRSIEINGRHHGIKE